MACRLSDDDCSVGHKADFVDASADTEVDVRLPPEVDRRSDPLQKDIRISRELLMRAPSTLTNKNNIDLSPRTGPDLNGPNTSCHCRTFSGLGQIN